MARRVNAALAASIVIVCSSCMLGHKYRSPEMELPQTIADIKSDSLSFADSGWREIYPDTALQRLIAKTLDNNKDMLVAATRVEELRRLQRVNTAALLPTVGADVSAGYEVDNYGGNNPDRTATYNGKLQFGWEIDLWGNLRWARQRGIASTDCR